ncbi:IPT/TIG domain-containing protein [candidate division KSB1 bacterium]|nr:IPT/TIG domain-containing protein [candidate division KSB1 bacterium]
MDRIYPPDEIHVKKRDHYLRIIIIFLCSNLLFVLIPVNTGLFSNEILENRDTKSSIPVVPGSKGDVDGNGEIGIIDLIMARDLMLNRLADPNGTGLFAGDIDSDGRIDRTDIEELRKILLLKALQPPTIFGIEPTTGTEGVQVTINGAGFSETAENNLTTFNGVPAHVFESTPVQLLAVVPAGASSGPIVVRIGNRRSNGYRFEVQLSGTAPYIEKISPSSALWGQRITIDGKRFGSVKASSTIKIGNLIVSDSDILAWSDGRIALNVPVDAFPGLLTVKVGEVSSNAVLLNVIVIQAAAPDPQDVVENREGVRYVRNEVFLDFKDDISMDNISSFLKSHNLTQVGMIFRTRKIQARIVDGRDPFNVVQDLSDKPELEAASPSLELSTETVSSESYPEFLLKEYNKEKGIFDYISTEGNAHHYAMYTFPGHRLVEKILDMHGTADLPDVRIGILDSGLGNGESNDEPPDLKSRIVDPVNVGIIDAYIYPSVTDISHIPDSWSHHGTQVAALAAGSGQKTCLGIGKHVKIRPIKINNEIGKSYPVILAGGLEIALSDPNVRVINLSTSSYNPRQSSLGRAFSRISFGSVATGEIYEAVAGGKIVVCPAGNTKSDTYLDFPRSEAPKYPKWSWSPYNLLMVVSGTEKKDIFDRGVIGLYERKWRDTNFGTNVSVCANAMFDHTVLDRDYDPYSSDGTSLSAPLVSGLAAEMIFVDEVLSRRRSFHLNPKTIVKIIEQTADDLSPPEYDPTFGNGRINVWKALLATANGGLASTIDKPEWYGFDVRASVVASTDEQRRLYIDSFGSAQIFVNDKPLSDTGNKSMPFEALSLFKRVPPPRYPEPPSNDPVNLMTPAPYVEHVISEFCCHFSVTTDEILSGTKKIKKLQLRKAGQNSTVKPFFEMPLVVDRMKNGLSATGVCFFDDYVFQIRIPRVEEVVSPKDGTNRKLTVGNVIYPIGTAGDDVEIAFDFPNEDFTPLKDDLLVDFNSKTRHVQIKPETVENHRLKLKIPNGAESGPITLFYTNQNDTLVSFSSLNDFIIPTVVDINSDGTKIGDIVSIQINVPHFDANISNTEVQFPDDIPRAPVKVIKTVDDPSATHIIEARIAAEYKYGPTKVFIRVDENQKVAFEGEGLYKINYCEIVLQAEAYYTYSDDARKNQPKWASTFLKWEAPVRFENGLYTGVYKWNDYEQTKDSLRVEVDPKTLTITDFYARRTKKYDYAEDAKYEAFIKGKKGNDIMWHVDQYGKKYWIVHGPAVCDHVEKIYMYMGVPDWFDKFERIRCDSASDLEIKLWNRISPKDLDGRDQK